MGYFAINPDKYPLTRDGQLLLPYITDRRNGEQTLETLRSKIKRSHQKRRGFNRIPPILYASFSFTFSFSLFSSSFLSKSLSLFLSHSNSLTSSAQVVLFTFFAIYIHSHSHRAQWTLGTTRANSANMDLTCDIEC